MKKPLIAFLVALFFVLFGAVSGHETAPVNAIILYFVVWISLKLDH